MTKEERAELEREKDIRERDEFVQRMLERDQSKTKQKVKQEEEESKEEFRKRMDNEERLARGETIIEEDGSKILFIKLNKEISPYIASKGSITIEGVSLTVNDVENDYFNVNIIPFTWDNTNLRNIKVNHFVNVEIDLLSRYLVNYQKRKDN